MKAVTIAGRKVGEGRPIFIIAEIGVNHNGSLAMAKRLINAAKVAGADAVKLQMCDPDEMVIKTAPKAAYQKKTTSASESQYEMLKRFYFGVREHRILMRHAKSVGIILFSTAFSIKDARNLISLRMPAFKVGSSDTNNIPQLRVLARSKKPILLSTGMSALAEIKESVAALRKVGNGNLIVFQCTTQYPAEDKNTNLRAMDTMRVALDALVGYSDHTSGIDVALAAAARGAVSIEKHITLDKTLPGPDHFASLEPKEFASLVHGIRRKEIALGSSKKIPSKEEKIIAKIARKSIVAARALHKGQKLELADFAFKRPGIGIPPSKADTFVGRTVKRHIPKDALLSRSDFV